VFLFLYEGYVEAMFDLSLVVDFRLFKGYVVLFFNLSFWVGFHLYFSTRMMLEGLYSRALPVA
jgi:hypothetical protein